MKPRIWNVPISLYWNTFTAGNPFEATETTMLSWLSTVGSGSAPATTPAATLTPPLKFGPNGMIAASRWSDPESYVKTFTRPVVPGPVPTIMSPIPSAFTSPTATVTPPVKAPKG